MTGEELLAQLMRRATDLPWSPRQQELWQIASDRGSWTDQDLREWSALSMGLMFESLAATLSEFGHDLSDPHVASLLAEGFRTLIEHDPLADEPQ
jgi:hypothetical protein